MGWFNNNSINKSGYYKISEMKVKYLTLWIFASNHLTKLALLITGQAAITLAYSSPSTTTITRPGPNHAAAACTFGGWSGAPASSPSAQWIWDGNGYSGGCPMDITISHSFTIRCINQPLTLTIRADNFFWSYLNGVSGYGDNWGVTY